MMPASAADGVPCTLLPFLFEPVDTSAPGNESSVFDLRFFFLLFFVLANSEGPEETPPEAPTCFKAPPVTASVSVQVC